MTTPKVVPVAVAEPDDSVGASPLGAARYLISQMITDLDVASGHIDGRLQQSEAERDDLRERFDEAEVIRHHVQNNLHRLLATDIEEAFLRAAALRSDLAAVEERIRELRSRHAEIAEELEALRAVHRSLDDLAELDGTSVADGAARFRSASRQVFQIIEEERMRIARDMHDGPAQSMANLVLQAEVLERLVERDPSLMAQELSDFKNGVRGTLEETRRLIFDLRPMTLDDLGLVPTLRKFVREFGEKAGVDARFHLVGEERRLPGNYEAVLFRIVQEAVTNVRKHARAKTADVVITLHPRRVVAVVRDDGEGFDVAATEARQGRTRSLGLISMRERADLEKGSLEVRSQIGRGTEIRVVFDF